jgi:hypothetical protein
MMIAGEDPLLAGACAAAFIQGVFERNSLGAPSIKLKWLRRVLFPRRPSGEGDPVLPQAPRLQRLGDVEARVRR